jgi:asparagine synthase (glutamine-hydrolysing)
MFLARQYLWEFGEDVRLQRLDTLSRPLASLDEALAADLINGKLEHYLRYADRSSMAHSREVRLPFLSHSLVESVLSVPASFRFHDGWPKYLTRAAMDGVVPDKVLWRSDKIGFATPHQEWMSSPAMVQLAGTARDFLVREGVVNAKWRDTGMVNWELTMAYFLIAGPQ